MTLDELYEHFDSARRDWAVYEALDVPDRTLRALGQTRRQFYEQCENYPLEWFSQSPLDIFGPIVPVVIAAKVYQIASEEGLDAAMVWKLANG